jgi:acyl-CoA thioester hydrolase
MKTRIYYDDTDVGGVVYHTNYLKYCERARSEIFFSKNRSPSENGSHFVVKSLSCNFLSPAFFADEIEVKTKLLKMKNASMWIEQKIFREDKELFNLIVELAYIGIGAKPKKIPQDIKELLLNS